ncbi:Nucleolar protein 12 [Smittium culicis]|uniref:Nucleolar protein 12 n=1 Tax=Smittium culicis TaxID=133412 RepID=A0A1R1YL75_9FUNG|nr:Nucleolar protein 12 [Smittium culicis]
MANNKKKLAPNSEVAPEKPKASPKAQTQTSNTAITPSKKNKSSNTSNSSENALNGLFSQKSETFYSMIEKKATESIAAPQISADLKEVVATQNDAENPKKRKGNKNEKPNFPQDANNVSESNTCKKIKADPTTDNADKQDPLPAEDNTNYPQEEPEIKHETLIKHESIINDLALATKQVRSKKELIEKRTAEKEEQLPNTIFVGNVPIDTLKNKAFSEPLPKKVAYALKKFNAQKDSCNAYVVFEKKEDAESSKELNGTEFKSFHLRVDSASIRSKNTGSSAINSGAPSHKNAVFVGNLNFAIKDETLRSHFANSGEIDSVRIIRDPRTGFGKGFGYVNFVDESYVSLALKLNDSELEGRKIRVVKCSSDPKKKNKAKSKTFDQGVSGHKRASKEEGTRSVNPNAVPVQLRGKNKKAFSLRVKNKRK